MKAIRNMLIISAATMAMCAGAAYIVTNTWWNAWLFFMLCSVVYVIYREW